MVGKKQYMPIMTVTSAVTGNRNAHDICRHTHTHISHVYNQEYIVFSR